MLYTWNYFKEKDYYIHTGQTFDFFPQYENYDVMEIIPSHQYFKNSLHSMDINMIHWVISGIDALTLLMVKISRS